MRALPGVVVLLGIVLGGVALAADPPGGPGWYQLTDQGLNVSTTSGFLLIASGTPGFLISVGADGTLRLRFERGLATWLGREVTTDTNPDILTVTVPLGMVRAFIKQPQSRTLPSPGPRGGAEPGALGAIAGGGIGTAAGVGGSRAVGVRNDTTLVVDDAVNVVRRGGPDIVLPPEARRPAPALLPPSAVAPGGGGAAQGARVIGLDEHEALLAKLLRWLGEEGANCETKGYGPGWVSVCTPRGAA